MSFQATRLYLIEIQRRFFNFSLKVICSLFQLLPILPFPFQGYRMPLMFQKKSFYIEHSWMTLNGTTY